MHVTINAMVSFGAPGEQIRVPVGISPSATEKHEVGFTTVHDCGHGIMTKETAGKKPVAAKQIKWCTACDREITPAEAVPGIEYMTGKYVTFSKEEVEQAKGERSTTIRLHKFVPSNQINTLMLQKTYFLVPSAHVQNGYAALYQALALEKVEGIGFHSLWGKQQPVAVYAEQSFETGGVLAMRILNYSQDSVAPDFGSPIVDNKLRLNTRKLVKGLTDDLTVADLHSYQRDRINAMVEAKINNTQIHYSVAEADDEDATLDLDSALKRSIAAMRTE